jgi:hypothetical protein
MQRWRYLFTHQVKTKVGLHSDTVVGKYNGRRVSSTELLRVPFSSVASASSGAVQTFAEERAEG